MQRAAASAATSTSTFSTTRPSPITHASGDRSDAHPSPKRQKLSNQNSSPILSADLQAISAAVKAEEEKRAAAVARQAAEAGEAEWVLEFSAMDGGTGSGSDGVWPSVVPAESLDVIYNEGRRSYGNFRGEKRVDVCNFL